MCKGPRPISRLCLYELTHLKLSFQPWIKTHLNTVPNPIFEDEGAKYKVESLSKLNTYGLSHVITKMNFRIPNVKQLVHSNYFPLSSMFLNFLTSCFKYLKQVHEKCNILQRSAAWKEFLIFENIEYY